MDVGSEVEGLGFRVDDLSPVPAPPPPSPPPLHDDHPLAAPFLVQKSHLNGGGVGQTWVRGLIEARYVGLRV